MQKFAHHARKEKEPEAKNDQIHFETVWGRVGRRDFNTWQQSWKHVRCAKKKQYRESIRLWSVQLQRRLNPFRISYQVPLIEFTPSLHSSGSLISGRMTYEFDLDLQFGSEIPSTIIHSKEHAMEIEVSSPLSFSLLIQ